MRRRTLPVCSTPLEPRVHDMSNQGQQPPPGPPPHPLANVPFLQARALLLEDWAQTVVPRNETALAHITSSVTYGSSALQASYLINGGALAALPAIVTSLTDISTARIALAAVPFVIGIAATGVASLAAYLNFQWTAEIEFYESAVAADNIASFYHQKPKNPPDPKTRENAEKRRNISFCVGVGAGLSAFLAFIVGAFLFIALVLTPKSHSSSPPMPRSPKITFGQAVEPTALVKPY